MVTVPMSIRSDWGSTLLSLSGAASTRWGINTLLYSTLLYSTLLYSTLLYSTLTTLLLHMQVGQNRLPPDHSHTWQCDGLFSVIEGWLEHEGFKGTRTVSELIEFLRLRFSQATASK